MEEALTAAVAAFAGGLFSYPLYRVLEPLRFRVRRRARQLICTHAHEYTHGWVNEHGVKRPLKRCSTCKRERVG